MSISSTAIIAITKQGIAIARKIGQNLGNVQIYVPAKHKDLGNDITWFKEQTGDIIASLFKNYDALICIFSLGAVIRLIAPVIANKKSDPAVLVIDDKANFVISALSGHLGGANELARKVSSFFPDSRPVITTAADVNETISVDLIGREFGWEIEFDQNVTRVSALMVNEEMIGLYQDAGQRDWWNKPQLPRNITMVTKVEDLKSHQFKGCLIISDRIVSDRDITEKSVVYRPKNLIVGIGLHWTTSKQSIESAIKSVLDNHDLSWKSIEAVASVDRGAQVKGLQEFSRHHNIPIRLFDKCKLNEVKVPNPSEMVLRYEGTASVSEASALLASQGDLVIPKQKFPPDLTVAVARKIY
jgi:cobalt-precorrin 5A hydrolase